MRIKDIVSPHDVFVIADDVDEASNIRTFVVYNKSNTNPLITPIRNLNEQQYLAKIQIDKESGKVLSTSW